MADRRRAVAGLLVAALIAATAAIAVSPSAGATTAADGPHGVPRLGPVDPRVEIPLTIALRVPGAAALEAYVRDRADAGGGAALTPAEIGSRFGLPQSRIDTLVARLEHVGIHVTQNYAQRTVLLARAPAAVVERVFHVGLTRYREGDATFWRPSADPRPPAAWKPDVDGVFGLDTSPTFRSHAHPRQASSSAEAQPLTPQQLAHVYKGDTLGSGIDGTGQSVAVLSLATLRGDEMRLWAAHFKTKVGTVKTVSITPTPAAPSSASWDADGEGEVALDLEMVRAIAPGATILNYTTANNGGAYVRLVNRVVADGKAKVVTTSWGQCESRANAEIRADEVAFAAAQAAGIDVFAASGDSGPYDCSTSTDLDPTPSVDYPAASPHVIGVGGTTLQTTGSGAYLGETGWWTADASVGAGGGVSDVFSRPSWQAGLTPAGGSTSGSGAAGSRLVPDLAGPADNTTNLEIAVWYPQESSYVVVVAGGTSAAAPFWGATLALIRQYATMKTGKAPVLGDFGPLMYRIASGSGYRTSFHDVTAGTNPAFATASGWDAITGLGTPQVPALARQVVSLLG